MKSADDFVALIRELIRDEINKNDTTLPCLVESVNFDDTVNIYLLPDRETVIPSIPNGSKYELKAGDSVLLYKVKNQISNAFIIAKLNP